MQSTNANDGTMSLTVTFDVDTDPTWLRLPRRIVSRSAAELPTMSHNSA